MPDPNRVYGGFSHLEGGVNSGVAPDLLPDNQCQSAVNITFRGAYPQTRPPYSNLLLDFDSPTTQTNIQSKFQGACYYPCECGFQGFVASVGGRLFQVELETDNTWSEITPRVSILTTADFTVPALNATVLVSVNNTGAFSIGQTVIIDSGMYGVVTIQAATVLLRYNGGAANVTAVSGNPVRDAGLVQLSAYQLNPPQDDLVYLFSAENYVIALASQQAPVIFDGNTSRLAGPGEIPSGNFGIYAWGRIWISLNGGFNGSRSFVAGDLNGSASGTASLDFVDAILKVTENTFLNGGGNFSVPNNAGPITGFAIQNVLDTSLGIGPILVGTTNSIVSVNAPVDRTTWQNLTYPIQTMSLVDYGPVGPRQVAAVNGDIWFRSLQDIRSFIVARRDINVWGNTPMSHEVADILSHDTPELLQFGSMVFFDNKLFCTVNPVRTPNGIIHKGLAVINFDLISSLGGKTSPAWEGVYTGLNIYQILKGNINGVERCFMFVQGADGVSIELWEMNKRGFYDLFQTRSNDLTVITRTEVDSAMNTAMYGFGDSSSLHRLETCELFIDHIVDDISIKVRYKPDEYPNWLDWSTVNLCISKSQCNVQAPTGSTCTVWQQLGSGYAAQIMLPRPDDSTCNIFSGKPTTTGFEFQFRLEISGHCRIRKFRPHALVKSDKQTGDCPDEVVCQQLAACGDDLFTYDSHGAGVPYEVLGTEAGGILGTEDGEVLIPE